MAGAGAPKRGAPVGDAGDDGDAPARVRMRISSKFAAAMTPLQLATARVKLLNEEMPG